MNEVTLSNLKHFIDSSTIPVVKQHIGFLDIIKKTTNEIINSNIYAYFLSCDDSEIKYAFINALVSIIDEKTNDTIQLIDTEVFTEFQTETGRIDFVIRDLINDTNIIIENKVYHYLNNNLLEYWDFIKVSNDKKRGVLLTLNNHNIPDDVNGKFINITHWEWISKVKELINIKAIKNINYQVYLSDFFTTIENLTNTHNMNESAKFYFENATQINAAYQTKQEGHKFLNDQYNLIAANLGMQTHGNELNWKNIRDEKNRLDTYFTIITENIVEGKKPSYSVILELYREDIKKVDVLNNKFKDHPQFIDKKKGKKQSDYYHYLVKDYEITIDEFENFADHVVGNIRKDFGQIFLEIVEYIYDKDISEWKNNIIEKKNSN